MDKAHGYADKTIEEIEKELKEIYATAQKELAKKAEAYMNKFIAEDEKQRKLLDTGKLTEKEYQQWLKKKVMSGQRFTKMKEQCAEQLTHANEIALDHINDRMADVYAVSYNALEKDVKGLSGYSFHIVSPDTVKTLAGRDSSLLPYKKLDPAKDIPWNMKAINSEVLQGVLQGESVKAITKRVFGYTTQSGKDQAEIAHKMQVAAARTAQTLITAAENKGRMDSYDRAEKDGVVIEKEWIATLDHATRDSHRELHKTTVPENQPFDNGLMYPGDPSGAPEEVYNCRCTMAAIVKGFTSVHNDLGKPTEHTVVEGHDISDTWERRADEFEFEINDVINAQGFDGLPRVVSAEEFDEFVKRANGGKGFIAQRTYSAESQEILDGYREQLYNGEWYVDCSTGGAQYGQGMYCAADYSGTLSDGIKAEMRHYKSLYATENTVPYNEALEKAQNTLDSMISSAQDKIPKEYKDAFNWFDYSEGRFKTEYISEAKYLKESQPELYQSILKEIKSVEKEYDNILDKIKFSKHGDVVIERYQMPSFTETLTLDPSAKIITYDNALELQQEALNEWRKSRDKTKDEIFKQWLAELNEHQEMWKRGEITAEVGMAMDEASDEKRRNGEIEADKRPSWLDQREIGSFIAQKGFDAINAEMHGESGSYTVILNRTKVIFKEDKEK